MEMVGTVRFLYHGCRFRGCINFEQNMVGATDINPKPSYPANT